MSQERELAFDFNRFYADTVGPMGLTESDLDAVRSMARKAHGQVFHPDRSLRPGFIALSETAEIAGQIAAEAAQHRERFNNFVVLGIGGSALGNIALQTALNHPFYNLLPAAQRARCPRLFVLDNIDPDFVDGALDVLPPEETLYNVISKSGKTAETLAQFMLFGRQLEERLGPRAAEHLIITTDADKGPLRAAADSLGCRSHVIPADVGGRFSVLTPVGLVSAAYTGIDVEELIRGAAMMRDRCSNGDMMTNPALFYAAAQYLFNVDKGALISVLFAYSHRLRDLADWYRQLLAESIGKRFDRGGKEVFTGVTPVKALGVTDQHSQVQLYAEGPADKTFTFLSVEKSRSRVTIPGDGQIAKGQDYLAGRTLADLFSAELRGTELALTDAGRPSCRIVFPEVTASAVGQFFFMMELHIAYAGVLYNINPFDQPGVEAGKRATFALMGRKGYEELREKIESQKVRPDRIL